MIPHARKELLQEYKPVHCKFTSRTVVQQNNSGVLHNPTTGLVNKNGRENI